MADHVQGGRSAKTICVIGGGAAGLAVLKVISESPLYKAGLWTVVAYEAREDIGGVWLPQASPPSCADSFVTPSLYDSLTANIPHPAMAFSDFSFPPSTPLFPPASVVLSYLKAYASRFDLYSLIRLHVKVLSVRWISHKWNVTVSTGQSLNFDFLVVANGRYRVPRIPDIPGLSGWLTAGRASHSGWYSSPHGLGTAVLVIGNGHSGRDIVEDVSTVAKVTIHSITGAVPQNSGNVKTRGRVKLFKPDDEVVFEDGTLETGIDHCILATGYEFSFPFFGEDVLLLDAHSKRPALPCLLRNSTYHLWPLALHIFPIHQAFPPTSIAFVALPRDVYPFPLAELQAHAILHVFERPEALNLDQEAADLMARWARLRENLGDDFAVAKEFLRLRGTEFYAYMDRLYDFIGTDQKTPEWKKEVRKSLDGLRTLWCALERAGEADDLLKGVGEGGDHEWVDLLVSLVNRVQEGDARVTGFVG